MEIMEDTNSNSQVSLNNNIIYVVLLVVTMNHVFLCGWSNAGQVAIVQKLKKPKSYF